jgi:ubiquinone/menaquinone biosynthesis C-methylase UbiE
VTGGVIGEDEQQQSRDRMDRMSDPVLQRVHGFWNTEACDTQVVENAKGDADFYKRFREQRYRTQWHIPLLVPFAEAKGKRVLEIGIGNGADGAMFALNGGIYTGVDLTEAALEATRKHFEVLGLKGTLQKENAEHLSFHAESFDLVYSHGVLHHTPNTQAAIHEVWRVLKPNGRAIIMLYHKGSFNYYVRIMTYMRLRLLFEVCRRGLSRGAERQNATPASLSGLRGNQDRRVWDVHYQNFLREGWPYFQAENFVHHCTDGPECPVARAFSKREARSLFARFASVQMKVAHFPLKKYRRWIPLGLEKVLAPRLGWYLFIFATKA